MLIFAKDNEFVIARERWDSFDDAANVAHELCEFLCENAPLCHGLTAADKETAIACN